MKRRPKLYIINLVKTISYLRVIFLSLLKRFGSILLAVLLIFSCAACSGEQNGANVYFELTQKPDTLDPQTAATDSELLLVKNLYEGLMRENEKGELVLGVAEDYVQNGLVYTFKIRKDAQWFTGENLTANDFVFAFRRAVSPDTAAPFAVRLSAIENAEEIINGRLAPEKLGVSAPDKHTLVIQLSREDGAFLKSLTTSVCMPCQEKFFQKSGGKYGLSKDDVLANGSYYLSKWDRDNFGIRLYKNAVYSGNVPAKNGAVFLSCSDKETALERLQKGTVDAAFLSDNEFALLQESEIKTVSCEDTCWVLTVGAGFRGDVGNALAMLINPALYEPTLPENWRVADSLLPDLFKDSGVQKVGRPTGYDPEGAKNLFVRGLQKMKDQHFPETTLYYYSDSAKEPITAIVGHWQSQLSAFINIEEVSSVEKLLPQLENQTLPLCFFPVKANSSFVREYLLKYGADPKNGGEVVAQQNVLSGNRIIPIAFTSTTLGYTEALDGLPLAETSPDLDFAMIKKNG